MLTEGFLKGKRDTAGGMLGEGQTETRPTTPAPRASQTAAPRPSFLMCCRRSRRESHGSVRGTAGNQGKHGPFHVFVPEGHLSLHKAEPARRRPPSFLNAPGAGVHLAQLPPCAWSSSLARLLENFSTPTLNVFPALSSKSQSLPPSGTKRPCSRGGPGQPTSVPFLVTPTLPPSLFFPPYLSCLMSSEPARLLRVGSCRIKHKWISNQQRTFATSKVEKAPSTLARGCAGPHLCSRDSKDRGATRGGPRGQETPSAPNSQWSRECHGIPPRSLKLHRQKVEVPRSSRATQPTSCPGLSECPRAQGLRLGNICTRGSSVPQTCPRAFSGSAPWAAADKPPTALGRWHTRARGQVPAKPWGPDARHPQAWLSPEACPSQPESACPSAAPSSRDCPGLPLLFCRKNLCARQTRERVTTAVPLP